MQLPKSFCLRCVVGGAVYLASACGAPAAAGPAASSSSNNATTVLSRDQFGQVQADSPGVDTQSPAWLASIEQGDVMSYRVQTPDSHPQTIQLRVERMQRLGNSAAALLVPIGTTTNESIKPHWIAGDADGLYELQTHESLLDPGFTPLDAQGRVIDSGRNSALFRVPRSWDEVVHHETGPTSGGWSVEELDLTLDGPVRGDRCARISKQLEGTRIRMTVCANVGMVDLQRGDEQEIGESWELIEIARLATPAAP